MVSDQPEIRDLIARLRDCIGGGVEIEVLDDPAQAVQRGSDDVEGILFFLDGVVATTKGVLVDFPNAKLTFVHGLLSDTHIDVIRNALEGWRMRSALLNETQ